MKIETANPAKKIRCQAEEELKEIRKNMTASLIGYLCNRHLNIKENVDNGYTFGHHSRILLSWVRFVVHYSK